MWNYKFSDNIKSISVDGWKAKGTQMWNQRKRIYKYKVGVILVDPHHGVSRKKNKK